VLQEIRSTLDSTDSASLASQEKAESCSVAGGTPAKVRNTVEDEEQGCFYCGCGSPNMDNFRFKDLINGVKYPYLVIRRLLKKRRPAK